VNLCSSAGKRGPLASGTGYFFFFPLSPVCRILYYRLQHLCYSVLKWIVSVLTSYFFVFVVILVHKNCFLNRCCAHKFPFEIAAGCMLNVVQLCRPTGDLKVALPREWNTLLYAAICEPVLTGCGMCTEHSSISSSHFCSSSMSLSAGCWLSVKQGLPGSYGLGNATFRTPVLIVNYVISVGLPVCFIPFFSIRERK
jgi:hypothetical protein